MADYIEIIFKNISAALNELLIAKLSQIGFEGFEEEENNLKAFIPVDNFDETLFDEVIQSNNLSFNRSIIKETNWNQLWESNFQPVVIKDLVSKKPWVAIRADFHDTITEVKYEIVITPKMSFGTGHHATTRMMIQQMSEIDFLNKRVFDFGTGTGILSILAEKLGAEKVIGIDNDEYCIKNAIENLLSNNCVKTEIKKSGSIVMKQQFDIILANINKNVILDNFSSLINRINAEGVLLLSGLLKEDEKDILKEAKKNSMQIDRIMEINKWISIRFIC